MTILCSSLSDMILTASKVIASNRSTCSTLFVMAGHRVYESPTISTVIEAAIPVTSAFSAAHYYSTDVCSSGRTETYQLWMQLPASLAVYSLQIFAVQSELNICYATILLTCSTSVSKCGGSTLKNGAILREHD
jgi:hypothetical protein